MPKAPGNKQSHLPSSSSTSRHRHSHGSGANSHPSSVSASYPRHARRGGASRYPPPAPAPQRARHHNGSSSQHRQHAYPHTTGQSTSSRIPPPPPPPELWKSFATHAKHMNELHSYMQDQGLGEGSATSKVYVFADLSNIIYPLKGDAKNYPSASPLPLSLDAFADLVINGRKAECKYVATSQYTATQSLERAGFHVDQLDGIIGPDGKLREQGIDDALAMRIDQVNCDLATEKMAGSSLSDRTIILVTGDGARSEYSDEGFMGPLQRALRLGVNVEVWSWDAALSDNIRDLQRKFPTRQFHIYLLDPYEGYLRRCKERCKQ